MKTKEGVRNNEEKNEKAKEEKKDEKKEENKMESPIKTIKEFKEEKDLQEKNLENLTIYEEKSGNDKK